MFPWPGRIPDTGGGGGDRGFDIGPVPGTPRGNEAAPPRVSPDERPPVAPTETPLPPELLPPPTEVPIPPEVLPEPLPDSGQPPRPPDAPPPWDPNEDRMPGGFPFPNGLPPGGVWSSQDEDSSSGVSTEPFPDVEDGQRSWPEEWWLFDPGDEWFWEMDDDRRVRPVPDMGQRGPTPPIFRGPPVDVFPPEGAVPRPAPTPTTPRTIPRGPTRPMFPGRSRPSRRRTLPEPPPPLPRPRVPLPIPTTPTPRREGLPPNVPDWTSPFPVIRVPPVRVPRPTPVPVPRVPAPAPAPLPPDMPPPVPTIPEIVIPRPPTMPQEPEPARREGPAAPNAPTPPGPAPIPPPIPQRRAVPRVVPRFPVPLPFPTPTTRPAPWTDPTTWPLSTPLPPEALPSEPSLPRPDELPSPNPIPNPAPNPSPGFNLPPEPALPLPQPQPTPLTWFNNDPLPLAAPRADSCECPDPERREKNPSSVVARVKAFARRMSQNSLDNLRRGFDR